MDCSMQAPLSSNISKSWIKFMSIESLMLSNHLMLCSHLFLLPSIFPASGSFPVSWLFPSGVQSIGASTSASVLPVSIQGWCPLGLTGLISLQSKGLWRVFSSTKLESINSSMPSLLYDTTYIHMWLQKNHSIDYTDLCQQSIVSAF